MEPESPMSDYELRSFPSDITDISNTSESSIHVDNSPKPVVAGSFTNLLLEAPGAAILEIGSASPYRMTSTARCMKRALEENNIDSPRPSKNRRYDPPESSPVDEWLDTVKPVSTLTRGRSNSAPPELTGRALLETFQPPSCEPLRLIQIEAMVGPQKKKLPTKDDKYHIVLKDNGVEVDVIDVQLPEQLQCLIDEWIMKDLRKTTIDAKGMAHALQKLKDTLYSGEGQVWSLLEHQVLGIDTVWTEMTSAGPNVPWKREAVPDKDSAPVKIATPIPDKFYGYRPDSAKWSEAEKAAISHLPVTAIVRPGSFNVFPFLTFEMKSQQTGGTLIHAQLQAAGNGSLAVNAMRIFLEMAYGGDDDDDDDDNSQHCHDHYTPKLTDALAFSVCMDQMSANVFVHYHDDQADVFRMLRIHKIDFDGAQSVQEWRNLLDNIVEYCLGPRQDMVRQALGSYWRRTKKAHKA